MKFIKWFFIFVLVGLLLVLALGYQAFNYLHTAPQDHFEQLAFKIERGDSVQAISYRLNESGRIKYPRLFMLYARAGKVSNKIKAGEYLIPGDVSPARILKQLVEGEVSYRKLRIVEGSRYGDVLATLASNPFVNSTLEGVSEAKIASQLGLAEGAKLEGWFFPDTISFAAGTDDIDILRQGLQRVRQILDEEWGKRAENLPYETPYEALIMASIVEKETGRADERAKIAGVFVKRLRLGMRLQTDPTVIYGMGDAYQGNIRRRDLRTDTPYNTYTRHGLPPTPIALVGRAAIHAALHPEVGEAIFFVAKGDGGHQFSATLKEHEKAVREFQLRRKKHYRSAP